MLIDNLKCDYIFIVGVVEFHSLPNHTSNLHIHKPQWVLFEKSSEFNKHAQKNLAY